MTTKILAIALLALTLSACESSTENTNSGNENKPAATAPATPAASTSPSVSPVATTQLKAGDKVKVTIDGIASDATIVNVDEKAGKATVRVEGQKDKLVAISDISKQ